MKHASISAGEAADRLAIRELVEGYAHCADRRDAGGQGVPEAGLSVAAGRMGRTGREEHAGHALIQRIDSKDLYASSVPVLLGMCGATTQFTPNVV